MKTRCGVETLQFTTEAALQPMIALLSVVAVFLLGLRDAGTGPGDGRSAGDAIRPGELLGGALRVGGTAWCGRSGRCGSSLSRWVAWVDIRTARMARRRAGWCCVGAGTRCRRCSTAWRPWGGPGREPRRRESDGSRCRPPKQVGTPGLREAYCTYVIGELQALAVGFMTNALSSFFPGGAYEGVLQCPRRAAWANSLGVMQWVFWVIFLAEKLTRSKDLRRGHLA